MQTIIFKITQRMLSLKSEVLFLGSTMHTALLAAHSHPPGCMVRLHEALPQTILQTKFIKSFKFYPHVHIQTSLSILVLRFKPSTLYYGAFSYIFASSFCFVIKLLQKGGTDFKKRYIWLTRHVRDQYATHLFA